MKCPYCEDTELILCGYYICPKCEIAMTDVELASAIRANEDADFVEKVTRRKVIRATKQ